MTDRSRLSELDAQWLPGTAARYARVRDVAGQLRHSLHHTARHETRRRAVAILDGLDGAVATRKWGLAARRPTIALLAAATVLVSALCVLAIRPVRVSPDALSATQVPNSTYVGPQVGDNVSAYVARRNAELDRLAAATPDGPTLAVVSFNRFMSIQDAATVLGGVIARRVFFGVPVLGTQTEIGQSAVGDFVKDTTEAFATNARARARLAVTFGQLADASPARTDVEKKYRQLYANFAAANRIEAQQLARRCACVIGAVVDSTLSTLKTLKSQQGIRVIDVAPANVPANSLGFRPIAPDEVGTISSGNGAGQLNEIVPAH